MRHFVVKQSTRQP